MHTEEKQNRIYFDWLISSRSRDNELAARSKSTEKGDMDLLFAAVGRISRGGPTPQPPEGGCGSGPLHDSLVPRFQKLLICRFGVSAPLFPFFLANLR
jgi:hypothetical protein